MLAFYSKANSHRNKHELDLQHEFEPEFRICPALKFTGTNRDGDRRTEGHTDALVAVCGESNGVCPRLRDSTRRDIGARRRFINTLRWPWLHYTVSHQLPRDDATTHQPMPRHSRAGRALAPGLSSLRPSRQLNPLPPELLVRKGKEKERKEVYLYSASYCDTLKALRHGSYGFACK